MDKLKTFLESTAGAIAVLFFGLCLFSAVCIVVALTIPANEHIMMLFTGLVGSFSGALLTVITIHTKNNTEVTGKDSKVTINQAEPNPQPKT